MNGAVEHYKACRKHGIKPILGLEAYFVDDRATEAVKYERNHLTLLARERRRASATSSSSARAGFLEGYKRGKANVDLELLVAPLRGRDRAHRLPAVALLPAARRRQPGRGARARRRADAGLRPRERLLRGPEERDRRRRTRPTRAIVRIAREVGRPLVGTADVHYLRREDYDNHTALLCVQTKSTLAAAEAVLRHQRVLSSRTPTEMAADFAEWPEAIATTLEIAERCNVEIELGKMLIPRFPTPDGEAEEAYLRRLANEGLRARYGDPPPAEAVERLEMELGVIEKMGFAAYFLIVWDFVKFAKDNGIAVGPGRGSAAGSIVSYALSITDVDPLALRPAVRALPERRARVDAGHRHRLLGQGPRARDALRGRQVRPRVGRADRHLRPHVPARRHARRRARARLRLRHGRPAGEADPRARSWAARRRSTSA